MNKFEIFIYKARLAKRKKNYKMALKVYDKAIRLNPLDAKVYYERGNIKVIIGDIKGAERDFQLAKSLGDIRAFNVKPDLIL